MPTILDGFVDFITSIDEVLTATGRASLDFIDWSLKINGITIVCIRSNPLEPCRLPLH